MKFVPKITVKTVGFDSETLTGLVTKNKGEHTIVRIAGTVKSSEPKTSDLGDYTLYHGNFQANNVITGEEYRSVKLIVPGIAESAMEEMLGGVEGVVNVGLDITVEYFKPKNPQGSCYRFGVMPLMESKGDAIQQLMESFGALPKALAAPKGKK